MIREGLIVFLTLLSSCTEEGKAGYAPPPEYQTLHRPNFKGALFQFEFDDDQFLALSQHQGGANKGVTVFRDGDSEPVIFEERIHSQRDLQIWTFSQKGTKPEHILSYLRAPEVIIGERIFILNRGKKLAASVMAEPSSEQFRYTFKTDESFAAAGMSGSPIFQPRTGAVIGVLQTANHRTKATIGGFELLKMK